jgi:hypothetical protein
VEAPPQRATLVHEHVSATDEVDVGELENTWSVVAYLIHDSGKRERATLYRCRTRAEASAALERLWSGLKGRKIAPE